MSATETKTKLHILDSTLRDGAQGEGISFSVGDKIKILKAMDEFGIDYVEAGNPGSNPKDLSFFKQAEEINLKHTKLVAFGSTRRKAIKAEEDQNVQALLKANTDSVVIFGKSWDLHVKEVLKTDATENQAMIRDTVFFFKERGKEVIYDAEHFFDGYKANPEFALATCQAAVDGGADVVCLCDTNGSLMPDEAKTIVEEVAKRIPGVELGIHIHNDSAMAVASSIMSVEGGVRHIQGTFCGWGERTGNASLSEMIPTLQLKRGYQCVPDKKMEQLKQTAKTVAEIGNVPIPPGTPYVGRSAFTHKAGMHIDGVTKNASTYEHINPEAVGNVRRFLMSDAAGRSAVFNNIKEIAPELTRESKETAEVIAHVKKMEQAGYQFEGAGSTFELIVMKFLGKYKPYFELDHYKTSGEQPSLNEEMNSSAIIKISVGDTVEMTAAEGDGPVNALDKALRKALEVFYPQLKTVRLVDYKVRVLDSDHATAAKVRVLIESTDGDKNWTTVGVSSDIIKASWLALVDSLEYKLWKDGVK